MGLIARKLHRLYWLLRYWCMDKYAEQVHRGAFAAAVIATAVQVARVAVRVPDMMAVTQGVPYPRYAIWNWVVQIGIMILAALISYALRPRPQTPDPVSAQVPETKDGKSLREVFGTVWIDDSGIVGWKNHDPEPIRKKGGKK